MDRKYKHRGYMSNDREETPREQRPPEPRPARMDRLGPKTPRMVGTVVRGRCSNCGAVLAPGFDPNDSGYSFNFHRGILFIVKGFCAVCRWPIDRGIKHARDK